MRPSRPASPLHRDAALARESHRHELLDPTTLRWAAELLVELRGVPAAKVAEHLLDIAEMAGARLEVRWTHEETKRDDRHGRTRLVATDAGRRASR